MFCTQDSLEGGITINATFGHEAKSLMTCYSISLLLKAIVTIQINKQKQKNLTQVTHPNSYLKILSQLCQILFWL